MIGGAEEVAGLVAEPPPPLPQAPATTATAASGTTTRNRRMAAVVARGLSIMTGCTRRVGERFNPSVNFSCRLVVTAGVDGQRDTDRRGPGPDADAAFVRAVYAEHGPALLGYTTRLLGDRGRAEDIVQETLLRAWQHADRLAADDRPLRPWLFTVAGHLATDARRARQARPLEVSEAALAELPTGDELDRAIQAWQVVDALRALTAEHRAVLVETYYRGRSVSEAAAVLGIPDGTVKSRCYYALRALRLALQERGWTP